MKMTTFALALGFLTLAQLAHAAPATGYSCAGKNKLSQEAVVFDLLFSDHGPEEGFTNQSITVTKRGWERLEKPVTFQMYGASAENHCRKNELGEIFLLGDEKGFNMEPTEEGHIAAFKVSFLAACGGETNYDVEAYCFFE